MTRLSLSNGWRARAALLTILIAVSAVAVGDHPQNDAGSGGDAGDTRDAALLLPDYGAYEAQTTPHDKSDWFAVDDATAGPTCVEVEFGGGNNVTSTLIVETPSGERTVSTYSPGGKRDTLAVASSEVLASDMHFTPSPNNPNSGDPARPGAYSFTVSAKRSATLADAGTGTDAGSERADAIALGDGCHGGRIGVGELQVDQVDYYQVFISAGEALTYSLGADPSAPVQILLQDAAGNALQTAIGPDGIATYTVDTDQTVYLQTSTTKLDVSQFPYLVGIEVGPPEPGCHPYC